MYILDRSTSEQAAKSLKDLRNCSRKVNGFGDEAFGCYKDGKLLNIIFRSNQYVIGVDGPSEDVVRRFARYIDVEIRK